MLLHFCGLVVSFKFGVLEFSDLGVGLFGVGRVVFGVLDGIYWFGFFVLNVSF